jgi:hypothetical protein
VKKLIGKGPAWVSPPLHWVSNPIPFSRSEGPRMGYNQWAITCRVVFHFFGHHRFNIDFEWKLDFHTNMYRVDRPVSEQLRTQRRSNCHTLFLWFWSLKSICSSSPSASNNAKKVQLDKGMMKIWGCLVQGGLMFNDGWI